MLFLLVGYLLKSQKKEFLLVFYLTLCYLIIDYKKMKKNYGSYSSKNYSVLVVGSPIVFQADIPPTTLYTVPEKPFSTSI